MLDLHSGAIESFLLYLYNFCCFHQKLQQQFYRIISNYYGVVEHLLYDNVLLLRIYGVNYHN